MIKSNSKNLNIETSLLKCMQLKDVYSKYINFIDFKRLLPNTALLLKDYGKYFSLYPESEKIDFGKFYTHFIQDWHNKDISVLEGPYENYFRDDVFPAIENYPEEDAEKCLLGLLRNKFEDDVSKASAQSDDVFKIKQIIDTYEEQVNKITRNVDKDVHTIADVDFEVLDKSKGLEWCLPSLQKSLGGITQGQLIILSADFGVGKEQPVSAKISTPTGWTRMGAIKLGDAVNGQTGVAKVVGIFPQGVKPVYELTFSDGRTCEAGLQHLFEVATKREKDKYHYGQKATYTIKNVKELMNSKENLYIRTCEPVEKIYRDVIIPPYSLGVLLGDGCLTEHGLTLSSNEPDVVKKVSKELDLEVTKTKHGYTWIFRTISTDRKYKNYLVEKNLNCRSENKYIPEEYLHVSVIQRRDLLKGLMDTDGSVGDKNRFSFSTVSRKLMEGFVELCQSLGYVVSVSEDKRTEKYSTGVCYMIKIQTNDIIFSSVKHLDRYYTNLNKGCCYKRYNDHIRIVNIKYVRDEESQCILVDSEDHLYLTDNYVVTHNTALAISQATHTFKQLAKQGKTAPILYFNSEGTAGDVGARFLSNLYREHITEGFEEIVSRREEVRQKFTSVFNSSLFKVIQISNAPRFEDVKRKIDEYQPSLVIIDICDKLAPEENPQLLKKLYDDLRVLSGATCPIIGTSQSGDTSFFDQDAKEVKNRKWLHASDMYGSITGKGGAADTLIMIGQEANSNLRYVSVNKLKRGEPVRVVCELQNQFSYYKELTY